MAEVTISGDPGITELRELFEPGPKRQAVDLRGGRAAMNFLRRYHAQLNQQGGWENPALPTHGPGRKRSGFGQDMVRGWSSVEPLPDGVVITNTDSRLRQKVEGGTIRAKRASYLTIPIDPRAHARRVKEFEAAARTRVFRPRGKDFLAFVEDGKLKVAYTLGKSVEQRPWPGALPPEDQIAGAYIGEVLKAVDEELG